MRYIIDSVPKLYNISEEEIYNIKSKKELTSKDEEILLRFYITRSRKLLEKLLKVDITEDPLINRCDISQRITGNILEKNGFKVKPVTTQSLLGSEVVGHSFLLVTINNNDYMVDTDYRQFFTEEGCNIENAIFYKNMLVKTPDLGFYVKHLDSVDESTANKIIQDGYIKLTEKTAKDYLDPFYHCRPGKQTLIKVAGYAYVNSLNSDNETYSIDYDRIEELYGIKCNERSIK